MNANTGLDERVAWGMSATYKYVWYAAKVLIAGLAVFFLGSICKYTGFPLPAYFTSNQVYSAAIMMLVLLTSLPHPGFTKKELRSSLIWLGIFIAAMLVVVLLGHFFIRPVLFPGH
ncbi:hypothetical protein [Atopobium deltae]|uniref:Uncharacterized protein n=1 Tax=Atopobium deltae TaxID=1393034 RepID=A0A133XW12_9ACTN|nr:hypothetical protein [Atopobium deltae]KXB35120.1 hypothetical protein HMPREF3192_00485 [Atopobium deltae]